MLKKLFTKYARAIGDEEERRVMYRLYCRKTVCSCLFYLLCVAIIAEALIFSDAMEAGESDLPFLVFGFTLLLWLIFAIISLALWIKFRTAYRKILRRLPSEHEMPEIVSYRQKTVEANRSFFKSMWWAIAILAIGCVAAVALIVIESVKNPDSETFGGLGNAGIGILIVGTLIFCFALIVYKTKLTAKGKTVELQTEREAQAIDKAQGRKAVYSLESDNNILNFGYLFPNRTLCMKMQSLYTRQINATLLSTMLSCIGGIAIAVIFFSPIVFDWRLAGFAFPVLVTVMFLAVFFTLLPISRKQSALEREQKKELEAYPIYEKNLALFCKYEAFSKGKGNIFLMIVGFDIVLSYVLAALFPNAPWSLLSIVPLFVGVFVNNKLIAGLRKEAKPLEEEIDMRRNQIRFRAEKTEDEITNRSLTVSFIPGGSAVAYTEGEKSVEDTNLPIYLSVRNEKFGFFLRADQTKRVADFWADSRFDAEEKNVDLPESFFVGSLILDDDWEYPNEYHAELLLEGDCLFDREHKRLQFGRREGNVSFCRIFQNVSVGLSEERKIVCVVIAEVAEK